MCECSIYACIRTSHNFLTLNPSLTFTHQLHIFMFINNFGLFCLMQYIIRGMAGLQGPYYGGTNTFHRRNAIYGLYPDEVQYGKKGLALTKISLIYFKFKYIFNLYKYIIFWFKSMKEKIILFLVSINIYFSNLILDILFLVSINI